MAILVAYLNLQNSLLLQVMTGRICANTDIMSMLSLPREMHILLGEHLDIKTLACLVRICRGFRDVFTPMLYARWYSRLILDGLRGSVTFPLSSNISLAKEVEIEIVGWDETDDGEDQEDEEVQRYREERISQVKNTRADHITRAVELGVGVQSLKHAKYLLWCFHSMLK